MEPNEFKEMVDGIREVEMALGIESYELTEKAKKNKMFGRSLFVVRDVKKGEILSSESVRPNNALHPKFLKEVLGQRFNEDLEKGTPLSFNLISN